MGHQMRVFGGGHYYGKSGNIFPSLNTCNLINPNTKIFVDNIKNTWQSILETQLKNWNVSY